MKAISRRQFLAMTGMAAGAYALRGAPAFAGMMGGGMMGGGMGGGGMGGTGTIDPPVGAAFADPRPLPNLTTEPGVMEVALDARLATVDVNGTPARLMTYNGDWPGGTIRVDKMDLLRVRLSDSLPTAPSTNILGHPRFTTNLHTHGLHVSPGDNANGTHSDNMMVMLMPGDRDVIYEYDLMRHPAGNLNFYHPHLHGSVAEQVWSGMAGCLVVEDPTDVLAAYESHLMVLHDISIVNGAPAPHDEVMDYMRGLEGSTVCVNGKVNPRLTIAPGSVQRWRIVNASISRFYRLSLAGHTMQLIGTEGGLLDRPYPISELIMAPGERADILVKATGTPGASYKLLSLPYARHGNMASAQITMLTLTYKPKSATFSQSLPASLGTGAARLASPAITKTVRMDLSMGQGRGYINGITFTDHEHSFATHSMLGTHEIWEVTNSSGMDHPFHQHVNHVQVLSITGGDPAYARLWTTLPAWKDTVIVPKWGSVRLLVPVMDYEGMAMMHCHILGHEDIGMMGIWHLMGDGMPMPM